MDFCLSTETYLIIEIRKLELATLIANVISNQLFKFRGFPDVLQFCFASFTSHTVDPTVTTPKVDDSIVAFELTTTNPNSG